MTAVIAPFHPARIAEAEYEKRRAAIRELYGESATDAGAKRDQALATLFCSTGWTQEELAKKEGKSRIWIQRHLSFGRFLNFVPTGTNVEKLSEGRFRSYWERTDKAELNERIRFAQVERLIGESTLHPPPRPKIRAQVIAEFGDGKWHGARTMAKRLDIPVEQVVDQIHDLCHAKWKNAPTCERRRHGDEIEQIRIFKSDRAIYVAELAEKLTPVIGKLEVLSKRAPGTIGNIEAEMLATELRNCLKRWRG